jgi:hypothetical protein
MDVRQITRMTTLGCLPAPQRPPHNQISKILPQIQEQPLLILLVVRWNMLGGYLLQTTGKIISGHYALSMAKILSLNSSF